MDSYGELDEEPGEQKTRTGPEETPETLLSDRMVELAKLKGKLTKAKDEAVQSWLDSKPVIDDLEKLRSELADAKSRTALSNTAIPELEAQLETLDAAIRDKKDEELKIRTMINKINQILQRTQAEMELIKIERDEKHRARLKLKKVLRLRRQTLRTLQHTLRAVRLESEAYGTSTAEANRYIHHSEMDDKVVKLTQEEYHELTKKARQETSMAEWRISVSLEQKQAAKESKESAAKRLQNMHSLSGSRKREDEADGVEDRIPPKVEKSHPYVKVRSHPTDAQIGLQENKATSNSNPAQRNSKQQSKKTRRKNKRLSKRKNPSCFTRIRIIIVQKIKNFF
ncbi:OLC1v1010103C1 [Oldenlandia corymbosa var. corymbosa]|uniref:OLC1v1010103C1 n=1 Tax=Oldenlandia corymbosa var. corymbosa TaxID=529605 RepID=A0AAV1DQJ9_OLDCO|nr:OLC1v1010103C1 [Oldenlandia corymbosa var. corymbosa]